MSFREDMERARTRKQALSFHGPERPVAHAAWMHQDEPVATVQVYHDGEESFCFHLKPCRGFDVSVWTTEEGLQAIIGTCGAALARARIARETLDAAEAAALAEVSA